MPPSESDRDVRAGWAGGDGPLGAWEPPSTRAKPRRRWVIPVAVGVVAAVVVAGLASSGDLPGFGSRSHQGPALTFDQARPLASQVAYSDAGATQLALAVGVASSVAYTAPVANLTGSSCAPTGGSSSVVTIPAFHGDYTSGMSPAWFFLYWRSTPPNITFVAVLNGSAEYLGLISPFPGCVASAISGTQVLNSTVDSSRAAALVESYARPFVAAHPSALAVYVLLGLYFKALSSGTNEWHIGYSNCTLGESSAGVAFNASLNATSGTVLSHSSRTSFGCPTSTSILYSSGLGPYSFFGPAATVARAS